ncbi:signal peptidase I [Candidatus Gottesmanbacteria bacterium]|nr:signal peptidase I [Candidatus Gottesmanbacteria bacterium]
MEKQDKPRVLIDTRENERIPSVVVSAPQDRSEDNNNSPQNIITYTMRKIVNFFLDFLETIVVALSIFVVIYLFLMQPHEIKGSSMEPNFYNNQYILTDKISYRLHEPSRGDVVIFKAPIDPDQDYIKRVIGLTGDKVKVQNGSVYVNGEKLKEDYLKDPTFMFPGSFMADGVEITVPPGKLFVMGDNRPHSSDSRVFGPIPLDTIIGRAFIRYWPIDALGVLPGVHY